MAEETEVEISPTDVFQQQEKTIQTLVDVMSSQQGQVVFAPAAPAAPAKAPNYLLYAGIAVAAIYLLKK